MRIACIAPYVPYEGIDHAGGLYLGQYLAALRECGNEVTLFAPRSEVNETAVEMGTAFPVVLTTARRASFPVLLLRLATQGSTLPSGRAVLRRMPAAERNRLDEMDVIDLQWFEYIVLAPALRRKYPHKVIVGTAHDLVSQSVERASKFAASRIVRIKSSIKLPMLRRHEAFAINATDFTHVFKTSDIDELRAMGVSTELGTTRPALEDMEFDTTDRPNTEYPTIGFVAAFDRAENDEAARWILQEVMPQVWAAQPEVRIRLAGTKPSPWLTSQNGPLVEVTGYLPLIADAYRGLDAIVVPLLRGAGLKFKTAQAMALGLPIVSTTIGQEGMRELFGVGPSRVADTAEGFANEIIDVIGSLERERILAGRIAGNVHGTSDLKAEVNAHSDRMLRIHTAKRPETSR